MSLSRVWANGFANRAWRLTAYPFREVFSDDTRSFERGRMLVTFTYVIWFLYSLGTLRSTLTWSSPPTALLWNVAWLPIVPWELAKSFTFGGATAFSLLAALFPGRRLLRVLVFVTVFTGQGILHSRGKIDHAHHAWVWALFLLMFLPRISHSPTPQQRRSFLEVIWGAQAVALGCYTVAGIQKLWGAWLDWGHGPTVFHTSALARHVAHLTMTGDADGLLSDMVMRHPHFFYPMMLAALYLEIPAALIAFRPRLHATWGAGLIAMHAGIGLVMNIWFDPMMLFVGSWFLLSPFATRPFELNATLRDLPWMGQAIAALASRWQGQRQKGQIVIFYDGECGICSRFVRILLYAGVPDRLFFSAQQGPTWQALLAEKPYLRKVDSVGVLTGQGDDRQLRLGSEAVLWTMTQLRFPFCLGWLGLWVPVCIRDGAYWLVASNRGRLSTVLPGNACPLTPPELRERYLD